MSFVRLPPSIFWLLPFVWLWFRLIDHLHVEWSLNPQYSYGWAVPFLCAYLIWKKIENGKQKTEKGETAPTRRNFHFLLFAFCLLAFLYFPTRLVEEANPDWRLISWALAFEVIGLTLLALRFNETALRRLQFSRRDFLFPVCFFLVAVPWPTVLEQSIIQSFTRLDTTATVGLLGWLGVPAMAQGNVIEVATGPVGVDEACSGIRSFQATLMIALFFGELFQLTFFRRVILCLSGVALALVFNLARMTVLVWVAARKGLDAIAQWHDPAGVTILVACFATLWLFGVWMRKSRKQKIENEEQEIGISSQKSEVIFPVSNLKFLSIGLLAWIVLVEAGVEFWYRSHEARLPQAVQWAATFPTNNPTFRELPFPERTRQILRFDEGKNATWQADGLAWQVVFLRWNPGATALHLAQNHTPETCLPAAGHNLLSVSDLEWFDVGELKLPFRRYELLTDAGPLHVFYCLWDDRAVARGFAATSLNYGSRLAPVLAGLRNPGQRSLEIAIWRAADVAAAEDALRNELKQLIIPR